MRALVLFLIVVNLGYLGWATLIDVRDDETHIANANSDPNVQRLVLAAERSKITAVAAARAQQSHADHIASVAAASESSRPTISSAAPVAASTDNTVSKDGPRCISIGPFQDLTSAAQASATLKSTGRDSRQRLEPGQLWVGYWVSVPGFAKREDAERAVARLKQNGISDVYISLSNADAESSNVVLLGVFKESERAQRLLTEAKNLGFAAQISDRTRAGSVYWVDVDFPAGESAAGSNIDFSTLGAQPGKILRLEQRTCPNGAH
jgi:cell division septation protein DedD